MRSEPDFVNGSYVIVQKYLHDLAAWQAAEHRGSRSGSSVARSSTTSRSTTTIRPTNSHVSLNTIVDEDGVEHDILRDNMVFGDAGAGEYGTYYIAYAADPAVTELMLGNMFLGEPPGNYDRILDVSTAVTGRCSSCRRWTCSSRSAEEDNTATPSDGSLEIGSLKGESQ